ncbi:DUF7882 family protein [Frigoribacterium sp. CFBP 8751]|uniref:DUF7882 family protein n=1 Tax=Frigoribacterium sp. CFBP 8751 TaxID=2775277 RepID=UPI001783FB73|nr:hypothetical protein [Frigoribacterium sp. CFBP 8751]MBD8539184.1 hypothetical protein [Frigoribacterium sp. CFBP 8751]
MPRNLADAAAGNELDHGHHMGSLRYSQHDFAFAFADRVLAPLHVVIAERMHRGEAFFLTWTVNGPAGKQRRCIWLSPTIPLALSFDSTRMRPLNRRWIVELAFLAHSTSGLVISPEPA